MQKYYETGQDIELYLLNYRSSYYSPVEVLQNFKLKTKLSINEKHLLPKVSVKLYENTKEK